MVRGVITRRLFEESLRRRQGAVYIQKHARQLAACHARHTRVEKIVKVQSSMHPICFFEDDNKVISSRISTPMWLNSKLADM